LAIHYNSKISTDGLVLCLDAANSKSYPGSGTTWTDLSGNGNNGTLTNGPTYNSSNLGSLSFDGIDDYSTLTSNYTLSAGWTLSFWGNPIFDSTVSTNTVFYSASNPRTFSFYNSSSFPSILGIDFDASNNLYVTSAYTDGNGNLSTLKFNSSYQLDTNFNCGDIGFYSSRPWQTKVSTYYSGKLYVTYDENSRGKFNQRGLRRLNSNGSLDTSFNSGGVGFNLQVHDVEEDSNGKLYVAGQFTSYNGTAINRIVRLNTDGSIDTSFNVGTGFNALVYNLEWDSTNNKLYAFGGFTSYNGTSINRIIRLNSDGSIDNTFNSGTGFNSTTYIGKLDSNGKLYVGGFFTSYNGTGANRIIRLNSDGSIDTNFVYGTGINAGYVSHIEINSSGKIFVCGSNFSTYNGTTANDIVKLNSDGSIDTSFSTGTGFNGQVRILKQDSTGKLVVGASFNTSYNETTVSGLILLNSDGTLNTDIGSGLSNSGRLENYYTDFLNTSSILDLYEAGVTPQRIITSTELYSIFNGNTSIHVVESMSTTGTYRYYMNGVLLVESQNVPTTSVNIQGLMRGAFGGYWYKGKMSNISIYNRELSTNEIQQNYNALKSRFGLP
jgi:uncharacterized delta-60 repeat protein